MEMMSGVSAKACKCHWDHSDWKKIRWPSGRFTRDFIRPLDCEKERNPVVSASLCPTASLVIIVQGRRTRGAMISNSQIDFVSRRKRSAFLDIRPPPRSKSDYPKHIKESNLFPEVQTNRSLRRMTRQGGCFTVTVWCCWYQVGFGRWSVPNLPPAPQFIRLRMMKLKFNE